MAERPDYEQSIALQAAPARVTRAIAVVVAGVTLEEYTGAVQDYTYEIEPNAGVIARLVTLSFSFGAPAANATDGYAMAEVKIGPTGTTDDVILAAARWTFGQMLLTRTGMGMQAMRFCNRSSLTADAAWEEPAGWCSPAWNDAPFALRGVEFTAAVPLKLYLYNNTDKDMGPHNLSIWAVYTEEAVT